MNDDITEDSSVTPPSHPLKSLLTVVVLPSLLLGVAVMCAGGMMAMKTPAARETHEAAQLRIQATPLVVKTQPASIASSGTVIGAQQVRLSPEVSGRVVRMSPTLAPGTRLRAGEVLVQLDTRNYDAAVAMAEQGLAKAQLDVALERNRGEVAEREWELLGDPERHDPSLAKRLPQLHVAEMGLKAAEASLQQAKANLERSRITAPFNALVIEEAVDIGQVVQPGGVIATLVGTDAFWVQISLPLEKLDGMAIAADGGPGSPVTITQQLGAGKSVTRRGYVKQLMGQLDPQTRTAQVLVEIPDPFAVEGLPLLPGAYVDVAIEGKALSDTWEIPRTALEDAEYVWVVDGESSLRKRRVQIGWRTPSSVVITQGFQPGDQLVTSPLTLPIEGQVVTIVSGEEG